MLETNHIMGEIHIPKGSDLASVGVMGGTNALLAEVLVFERMRVSDVDTSLGFELIELVRGVGGSHA
jgi:hypothetical protein